MTEGLRLVTGVSYLDYTLDGTAIHDMTLRKDGKKNPAKGAQGRTQAHPGPRKLRSEETESSDGNQNESQKFHAANAPTKLLKTSKGLRDNKTGKDNLQNSTGGPNFLKELINKEIERKRRGDEQFFRC